MLNRKTRLIKWKIDGGNVVGNGAGELVFKRRGNSSRGRRCFASIS